MVLIKNFTPTRDLKKELLYASGSIDKVSYQNVNLLKNLLDKIFTLYPSKRPTIEQVTKNIFFTVDSQVADSQQNKKI